MAWLLWLVTSYNSKYTMQIRLGKGCHVAPFPYIRPTLCCILDRSEAMQSISHRGQGFECTIIRCGHASFYCHRSFSLSSTCLFIVRKIPRLLVIHCRCPGFSSHAMHKRSIQLSTCGSVGDHTHLPGTDAHLQIR